MHDVVDKLVIQHKELADHANLVLANKEYFPEFGGSVCLKYTNGTFSLMITKGRDGIGYYVGNGNVHSDNWYSIDIIWNKLKNNHSYQKMKTSSVRSVVHDNFNELIKMFSQNEREKTEERLHELEKSRSEKLLGVGCKKSRR
jgi:hypothetical protein